MFRKFRALNLVLVALFTLAIISCKKEATFHAGTTVKEILPYLNELRTRGVTTAGIRFPPVPPLVWNDTLGEVALTHSNDMAANDHYAHTGTDNSTLEDRLLAANYHAKKHAEDLALGPALPIDVVGGWKNNFASCSNFMDPELTEVGAAVASGPSSLDKDTIAHTNQSRDGGKDFFYWTLVMTKHK